MMYKKLIDKLPFFIISILIILFIFNSGLSGEKLDWRLEGTWEKIRLIDKRVIKAPEDMSIQLSPDTSLLSFIGNSFIAETDRNKYLGNISISADTMIFRVTQHCQKLHFKDSLICSEYDLVEYMMFKFLCEDFLSISFPIHIDTTDCSESIRFSSFLMEGKWENLRPYQRVKE